MCGISGIYYWVPSRRMDIDAAVRTMAARLIHRGPDSEGYFSRYFSEGGIAFGHRRLRIIDLATGDQPIYNEDRTIAIVFNGEIYNYKELRSQLEKRGHHFSTSSDTETIIHAYEEYGLNCLNYLNGMFSFALWDHVHKRLFLAVDRIGIKPLLYYYNASGWIAFASEISALLSCPGVHKQLNEEAMLHYFEFGYIPGPLSIYRNIYKLLPGHYLVAENGNIQVARYWKSPFVSTINMVKSFSDAKNRLRNELSNAVRERLMADVPLGAFLSGGVDSSIIVGLMARQMNKPVKTFSIGFVDEPVLDETDYAQTVARFNGTEHHVFKLSYYDILKVIPEALNNLGEPFADYSFLPTYLVSKEASRHVTVVLSGDGGDELFAGYNKYRGEVFQRYYFLLPSIIRNQIIKKVVENLPVGRSNRLLELFRQIRRFIDGVDVDLVSRHIGWMRIISPDIRASVINLIGAPQYAYETVKKLYQMGEKSLGIDRINQLLLVDLNFELPFDMLTKVDIASMRHSLEVRVPFLDYRVVRLAFAIPGRFKLKGTQGKYILRETFKDLLPKRIRKRRKQGFDLPIGEWIKKEMRDTFFDVVFQTKSRDNLLNYPMIWQLYNEHAMGRSDHTKLLWALFVFQWWRNSHPL